MSRRVVILLLAGLVCALAPPLGADSNTEKTLASLKKLDSYPLYSMRYYGDYGFRAIMTGGRHSTGSRFDVAGPDSRVWACSTFSVRGKDGRVLLGRNFDWLEHAALVLFTQPSDGYASVSMVDISYLGVDRTGVTERNRTRLLEAPLLPFDGMNAQGLGIGMMAVPHGEGGHNPRNATLSSLEVIRLVLDYAKTVQEAVGLVARYNVDFADGPPVHYLIADAAGDSAVLEFLDDTMHVLRGNRRFQVSTNFLLFPSPPQRADTGCWRYNRLVESLSGIQGEFSSQNAMNLLRSVSVPGGHPTIWSVAYDLSSGDLGVAMGRRYDRVHHLSLRE